MDYFLARYHSSAQGRFTSIDPYNIVMEVQEASDEKKARRQFVTYLSNPQRWNRYPYALNNPLFYTDPKGEDVTIYYVPQDKDVGHIFIYVRNDETGESAYFDYLPSNEERVSILNQVRQNRIDDAASITIETTAEQEQAILGGVKELQNSAPDWHLLGPNCVTKCSDILKQGGIDLAAGPGTRPIDFWRSAYEKYSVDAENVKANPPRRNLGPWDKDASPYRLAYDLPEPKKEYGHDPRGQARNLDRSASNPYLKFRGGKKVE